MDMDSINAKRARTSSYSQTAEEIRGIMLEYAKGYPDSTFHVSSDLNWLRYLKQVELVGELVLPQWRIMDLGCGLGHTTALLAAACNNIHIIGADISEPSTWSRLRKYGCEFCRCDATSLSFESDSFDAIVSFGVMEHVSSNAKFLEEVHRCLKKDGYNIMFQLPNKYSLSEFLARALRLWHHEKAYSMEEIRILLRHGSFDVNHIAREHVVPAQVKRVSSALDDVFNQTACGHPTLKGGVCFGPHAARLSGS